MSTPAAIVYGAYGPTSPVGTVVGFVAAEADLSITNTATASSKTANGITVQQEFADPGLEATGTLVVTSGTADKPLGGLIMIQRAGEASPRPYVLTAWKAEGNDGGKIIATFSAESKDSMIDHYLAGPVDPDTGTASNYVFGGLVVNTSDFDDFSSITPVLLESAEVAGTNVVGSAFVDGNKWRAVFPKAQNTGSNKSWSVILKWGSVTGTFTGASNDETLEDVNGNFAFYLNADSVS